MYRVVGKKKKNCTFFVTKLFPRVLYFVMQKIHCIQTEPKFKEWYKTLKNMDQPLKFHFFYIL